VDKAHSTSILLLRGTLALAFLSHAIVRLLNGSVPQFAAFLESRGFPHGVALVFLVSGVEIGASLLLLLGRRVGLACAFLGVIVVMGVALIHAHIGWFVGEHGVGGMEYSVLILAGLAVVATADYRRVSPRGPVPSCP
jgi:putative oxidoreductase